MNRRFVIAGLVAALVAPTAAMAQPREMPSADRIFRELERQPRMQISPQRRVTINEFKRRPELRRAAPSIDIQSINFATGSATIPTSQYPKVEQIGIALRRIIDRNPRARFLIEGHTDAVGSWESNLDLSERRAASLRQILVREFGISPRALETVGYGEEYLLVNTQGDSWQNRRVTIRRIDQFLR